MRSSHFDLHFQKLTEPLCFLPAGTKVRGDLDQASRFRQIDGSIANLVGHVNYK
jgi:hypothetical protein